MWHLLIVLVAVAVAGSPVWLAMWIIRLGRKRR